MKKKVSIIVILVALIVFIATNMSLAENMSIQVEPTKNKLSVGETVDFNVEFSEQVQAADYSLNYNSDVLEFVSASISEDFYNAQNTGIIKVSWFDISKSITKMTFTFKVKAEGEGKVNVVPDIFSTSNLAELNVTTTNPSATITTESGTNPSVTPSPASTPEATPTTNVIVPPTANNGTKYVVATPSPEPKVIPQTGLDNNTVILISIVSVSSILAFIGYKKLGI